jgi:hypothetical protein
MSKIEPVRPANALPKVANTKRLGADGELEEIKAKLEEQR